MDFFNEYHSTYEYTSITLHMRAQKSLLAEVLAIIPAHTQFEVIDADDVWLTVIYEGKIGYVLKQPLILAKFIQPKTATFLNQMAS